MRCEGPGGGGGGGDDYSWELQGCRHGRVLLINRTRDGRSLRHILVWNPVTGEHHFLGLPHFSDPNWSKFNLSGAVICASGDKGPFKVALAWRNDGTHSAHACVYSSETGVWGDAVSTSVQSVYGFVVAFPNVLVGNSLYWILFGFYSQLHILEFDLDSQNLSVIEVPLPSDVYENHRGLYLTTLANGGGLSLVAMSANLKAQLWERTPDSDGVARWMLGRTIELEKLLSLRSWGFQEYRTVLGLDGNDNVIFVSTYTGVFMVHLKLVQFEKIFETNSFSHSGTTIHPFTNLYAPGLDRESQAEHRRTEARKVIERLR